MIGSILRALLPVCLFTVALVTTATSALASHSDVGHYFSRFPWWNGHLGCMTQGYDEGTHKNDDKYALDIDIENGGPGCLGAGTVSAALAGTVVEVVNSSVCSTAGDYGKYVIVRSTDQQGRDRYSLYAHLASVNVTLNSTVLRGQTIGVEGDTGYTKVSDQQLCSVHLHYRYTSTQNCTTTSCAVVPEPMSGQTGLDDPQIWTSDNYPCAGGGPWSGWENLGGTLTSAPAAVSWGCNRIDVVAVGGGNALYHKFWNGNAWSQWLLIGGVSTSAPAIASWAPNRLDVFYRGSDGSLRHIWNDNNGQGWVGWENLGGVIAGDHPQLAGPAAVAWDQNRLDVFVRGTDSAIWHLYWNGSGWSSWEWLGGPFSFGAGVSSWGPNRLDVFTRGTDSALWHRYLGGGSWSGWETLGGNSGSRPDAVSWAFNRIDAFVKGSSGDPGLYHRYWSGSWSTWEDLNTMWIGSAPAVSSWGLLRLDVFARGLNGALWHRWH